LPWKYRQLVLDSPTNHQNDDFLEAMKTGKGNKAGISAVIRNAKTPAERTNVMRCSDGMFASHGREGGVAPVVHRII
jgi:hypothetical protein